MTDLQCPARILLAVEAVRPESVAGERIALARSHRPISGLAALLDQEPEVDTRLAGADWMDCVDELTDLCRGEAVLVVVAPGLREAVRTLRSDESRTVTVLG